MDFRAWMMESRIFQLPPQAKQMVDHLYQQIAQLNQEGMQGIQMVGELPDPFSNGKIRVALMDRKTYHARGYSGNGSAGTGTDGNFYIIYAIPMDSMDTIYHELVHAHDPKLRRGLSKHRANNGMQDNTTPHELEAKVSGVLHDAARRLRSMTPEQQSQQKQELVQWLKRAKSEDDLDPWNMPRLLQGMVVFFQYANPVLKRQFINRAYKELLAA